MKIRAVFIREIRVKNLSGLARLAEQHILRGKPAGVGEEARHLGGKEGRGAQDFGGGAVGDHLALAHEDDAIGEGGGQFHVVRDEDDGHAPAAPFFEQRDQFLLGQVVEAARRFVEQEDGGQRDGDGGEGHALAFAHAQVARVGAGLAGEAQAAQKVERVGGAARRRSPAIRR